MKKERSPNDKVRSPSTEHVPDDPVGERIKRRVARWDVKYNPERIAAILAAKSERMHENYAVQAEILGRVDHRVSEVIDAVGVSVIVRIWYKAYAREVTKIWRTIPSSCQELEYDVVRYKWTARGLDPILLVKVKVAVIKLLEDSGFPRKHDIPGPGEVRNQKSE
jgi:hypothetical protein